MSILSEIGAFAMERVDEKKIKLPLSDLKHMAKETGALDKPSFYEALSRPGLSFICEVKKASPSKGLIAPDFPYLKIGKEYDEAGADAISVLTEPKWFLGADEYLKEISEAVKIPCLRKDFTVDEYMIYEAKVLKASAVLLIVSMLSDEQLKEYLDIAHELSLDALVEAHDGDEIGRAVSSGARIIGVNNRNLKDFSVDTGNAGSLRSLIPTGTVFVSESGIKTREDIARLEAIDTDAVLIGETLMRADDKSLKLKELRGIL